MEDLEQLCDKYFSCRGYVEKKWNTYGIKSEVFLLDLKILKNTKYIRVKLFFLTAQ
jgi:hypothetical protein